MTLELKLIIGFVLHLVGDYLLQNDWMAREKTRNSGVALAHATVYALPFLLVCWSWWWVLLWLSHFFIDRYRLAVWWIKLTNWNWQSREFGYGDEKPRYIAVWLMIIIDNTFHLLINSVSIYLS